MYDFISTDRHDEDDDVNAVGGVGERGQPGGRPQEGHGVPEPADVDPGYELRPRHHEVARRGRHLGEGEAPDVRDGGEESDLRSTNTLHNERLLG